MSVFKKRISASFTRGGARLAPVFAILSACSGAHDAGAEAGRGAWSLAAAGATSLAKGKSAANLTDAA